MRKSGYYECPDFVLLGFAAWTLLTLFGSIGVYRWNRILTGRSSISEWRADAPQGGEWYQRAMRAHELGRDRHITGVMRDAGGIEWSFGRNRGLEL